jgi:predicted ferric reductase
MQGAGTVTEPWVLTTVNYFRETPPGAVCEFTKADRLQRSRPGASMLWTIFVILLVLWLLGMVTSYTLYGYIHILLVIAVVVLLIRLIQGRSVL